MVMVKGSPIALFVTTSESRYTVSRQNGQVDEGITLSHSASSCGVSNPRTRSFGHSLQWVVAAASAGVNSAIYKKVLFFIMHIVMHIKEGVYANYFIPLKPLLETLSCLP